MLGILGVVFCQLTGPFAWVMGNNALAEIDANPMAYANRSTVQAGRICGIIATCLLMLWVVAIVVVVAGGRGVVVDLSDGCRSGIREARRAGRGTLTRHARLRGAGLDARAVLRPGLRVRHHAGHRGGQRRADRRRPRPRGPGLRGPVVGVGRLRLADQRRRHRGGRPPRRPADEHGRNAGHRARGPHRLGRRRPAFALGYLVVMVLHAALFALAGESPEATRRAILRLAPTNLCAALLLVAAGLSDGTAQTALWVAAIAVNYAGPYITGVAGFTVHPGHFVERHGLIVIIALGESIVAIGAGRGEITVDWALAGTSLAVMALVAGLWWDYFTHDAEAGERALVGAEGHERARLARDLYSYLHVPLVLGIVFAAVGIHEVLAHDDEPLDPVFAGAYAGGVALYFAGLAGIRLRRGDPPGRAVRRRGGGVAGAHPRRRRGRRPGHDHRPRGRGAGGRAVPGGRTGRGTTAADVPGAEPVLTGSGVSGRR